MLKPKPKESMWTDDQWRAVVEGGQNILVSAGAGSGKTAVLTERIIEHIKNGIDVSKLVVLTFTNAAAREMRERVHSALTKAVSEYPHLKEQLTLLDAAQITTFDAYSQFLLKKYHYLLNIDSNIQIINSVYKTHFINQVVNQLFDEKYAENNEDFIKLIDQYSIMNDQKVRNQVIYLMDKLENQISDYDIKSNYEPQKLLDATTTYYQIINEQIEQLKINLRELPNLISGEKFEEHIAKLNEYYKPVIEATSYFELNKNMTEMKPRKPVMPRQQHDQKDEYKLGVEQVAKDFEMIKSLVVYQDEQEMITELKAIEVYQAIMINLAKEANQRLLHLKFENNMFDFIDISKLVIKIFEENPEITTEIKNNIFEIMIDEYQDTNDIQEYFISLIANNNVYMVGDIKQAIYGFRNANPQNFQTKYLNYSQNIGGMVIDLNKNFRSREEVLSDINEIFTPLMSKTIGGIDYVGKQRLIYGNKMYETKDPAQNHHMDIISYECDMDLTKAEQEARLIAIDIITKINQGYQVNEKGKLRKATFKDFAILTSKKKNFDLYKRVFETYKIPLEVQTTVNDDTKFEIYLINAIFRLLYTIEQNQKEVNREHFKFAFYSLLRNYPFEFTDADIAKQIIQSYNLSDVIQNPINEQFKEIAEILYEAYSYYQINSLVETLVYVIDKFKMVANTAKLTDVYASEMRIMEMINLFSTFSDQNLKLADVIEFEQLQQHLQISLDLADPIIINNNVAQMMTIHKSKGLEFNVVYFPEFDAKFNTDDIVQKYRMTKDFGYLLPEYSVEEKTTIYHEISKYYGNDEIISEQIRLFYVALTRAKDKMVMLLSDDSLEKKMPLNLINESTKRQFKNFKSFLIAQSGNLYNYNQMLLNENINYEIKLNEEIEANLSEVIDGIEYREIKVEPIVQNQSRASMQKHTLIDPKTKAMMNLGTTYHNVLETIDFTAEINPQITDLDPKFQKIVKEVSELEFVKTARKTFNEYQFQLIQDTNVITGIIDLLIETDDKMIILDYKLDDIDKPEYIEQINTYAKFVRQKTNKNIEGYLYSLSQSKLKEIEISE